MFFTSGLFSPFSKLFPAHATMDALLMFCLLVAYDVTLSNLFIWLFIFSYKNFISTKAEIKALTESEQQGANG